MQAVAAVPAAAVVPVPILRSQCQSLVRCRCRSIARFRSRWVLGLELDLPQVQVWRRRRPVLRWRHRLALPRALVFRCVHRE